MRPVQEELEEELLDDEDGEIPAVHASAQDDTEEETLEHAADLGSMIRDMSIDELTRPEPVELDEEEDDFDIDEEDLEEDELNSSDAEEGDEISASEVSEAEEDEFAERKSLDETGSTVATDTDRAQSYGPRRWSSRTARWKARRSRP